MRNDKVSAMIRTRDHTCLQKMTWPLYYPAIYATPLRGRTKNHQPCHSRYVKECSYGIFLCKFFAFVQWIPVSLFD